MGCSRPSGIALLISLTLMATACAPKQVNPAFSISRNDAKDALDEMSKSPGRFERPVVVLGGYFDPGLGPSAVSNQLRRVAGGERVIEVSFLFAGSFDDCRRDVIAAVEKEFPSNDPHQTIEVDVVGLSMGGVVGRYCATEKAGEKRLRVRRLYTISSPHRGAGGASGVPAITKLHRDLKENSAFLMSLEAAEKDGSAYEIVPYVRRGDWIVGMQDAAPRGITAYWVDTPLMEDPHSGAMVDPRILGDVSRRLRGQEPFTHTVH